MHLQTLPDFTLHARCVSFDACGPFHRLSQFFFTNADIFSQRLTVPLVDQFIADLKDSVDSVKGQPTGKGSMVTLYG
jgi:hypothetical protein